MPRKEPLHVNRHPIDAQTRTDYSPRATRQRTTDHEPRTTSYCHPKVTAQVNPTAYKVAPVPFAQIAARNSQSNNDLQQPPSPNRAALRAKKLMLSKKLANL